MYNLAIINDIFIIYLCIYYIKKFGDITWLNVPNFKKEDRWNGRWSERSDDCAMLKESDSFVVQLDESNDVVGQAIYIGIWLICV